jgi:hypothetical protein
MHPEAVLLVYHGKRQIPEIHVRLEQGVCADQDVDLSGRQALKEFGACASLFPAGEQGQSQVGGIG